MKKKTIIQAAIIVVLLATAIVLGVIALKPEHKPNLVSIKPVNTPEVVEIEIIPTPSPEPPVPTPVPTPETVPTYEDMSNYVEESSPREETKPDETTAFLLNINGERVKVAYGVEESTLKKTPGWLEISAAPGEEGVCVVYGHRNRNHLRALKGVELGDSIIAETVDGNYTYVAETIRIMDGDEELTIPTMEGKHLLLSTCYPFHYSGRAPQKYVVFASLV